MAFAFTVGGTNGTFDSSLAQELASVLDHAFGAEGDWEGSPPCRFGEVNAPNWTRLQSAATEALGIDFIPNLLALGGCTRGVYVPSHVQVVSLPISAGMLACASLPGLRRELAELAAQWEVALDDESLRALLADENASGDVALANPPEIVTFALLALAANEAVRRDCPLWVVG